MLWKLCHRQESQKQSDSKQTQNKHEWWQGSKQRGQLLIKGINKEINKLRYFRQEDIVTEGRFEAVPTDGRPKKLWYLHKSVGLKVRDPIVNLKLGTVG